MGRRLFFAGILVLFLAGRLAPGIGRTNAAAGCADAKEFYESTEGQGSHIRVLDGDIYFATKGKEASYGGGLRYTAAGFDICIKGNGRQIELAVKRGGTLKEVAGAAVLAGGYWYNLYRITLADIYQMAAGKQDPAAVLESDSAEIVMNAILILRQGNVDLGSIAEDGCGNVTEQGTVFHLKEESQWQMIRRIFSGHTFESYRDIHLSASWKPYIHNVWYRAGEGNSVEKETAKVVQGEAVDLAVRAGKDGWTHIGWNMGPDARETLSVCMMGETDLTLYAVYRRSVAISYDTGGSGHFVPGETKEQFYNASGAYWDPGFLLAAGVEWENHAFVGWQDEDGNTYGAGEEAELAKDMVFTAVWDQYPSIAAKDRYFTLRQAVRGEITEQALLERVTATDPEDGILENGERVRVLDYRESDYTGLTGEAKLAVTYEAVDSFGSRVTAQVTVHIVDTAPREHEGVSYVRFISGDFYRVGGEYVPTQAGGLLETSIWRTDEAYRIVLERALLKQALLRQALREHLSDTAEIKIPEETRAQAVIEHMEGAETWTFAREQVQEVKRFVLENGFGKYLNVNGIERFYRQFGACR